MKKMFSLVCLPILALASCGGKDFGTVEETISFSDYGQCSVSLPDVIN